MPQLKQRGVSLAEFATVFAKIPTPEYVHYSLVCNPDAGAAGIGVWDNRQNAMFLTMSEEGVIEPLTPEAERLLAQASAGSWSGNQGGQKTAT